MTAYPPRFNWPTADSSHPATLARTETQIHILTAGRKDICLEQIADAASTCKAGNRIPAGLEQGAWTPSSAGSGSVGRNRAGEGPVLHGAPL